MSEASDAIVEGLFQEGFARNDRTRHLADAIVAALAAAGFVLTNISNVPSECRAVEGPPPSNIGPVVIVAPSGSAGG